MSTKKSVKCKICGKKYVSKAALIEHLGKAHSSSIPKDWSPARFENYLRTGKTEGHCVYCKKETTWNETTGKYNRMCGSEACKKKARELANKNYIGVHGKPYSINDPEQQKKMIYGRKNSGTYIFEDEDTGKKYKAMYDSSYGKDFLEMIDTFLNWDGADIIAPSPNTYWYEYEGKKHFYIPDVYSTSLNLEIELKDGGDNPNNHPKIQAVDKVKEEKKDAVMESLKDQVNYIKICNKDYTEFFALLSRLKEKDVCQLPKWQSRLESITESLTLDDEEILQEKVIYGKEIDVYINRHGDQHSLSLTGSSYGDVRSKNVSIYNEKDMYDIIHDENIVESYNAYMEMDIRRIQDIAKRNMNNPKGAYGEIQSGVETAIITDYWKLIDGNVFSTEEELKTYLLDKYFDKIDDPNVLHKTLQLRYNWNKKVTSLLEKMLQINYLALGYTLEDANRMISKIKNGGSEKRETIDKIVDDIIRNPNLYRGNNSNMIDLTEFGAGKIYISDSQAYLIRNKQYSEAIMTNAVMYAFRYDVVIMAHGTETADIVHNYDLDDHSYDENDQHDNNKLINLFNDLYGGMDLETLIDSNTPNQIKVSINNIDKICSKYKINPVEDLEKIDNVDGMLTFLNKQYSSGELDDKTFVNNVNLYMKTFGYNPRKPIQTVKDATSEIIFINNFMIEYTRVMNYAISKKTWKGERTKIGDHESTINVERVIRNVIKDNADARTIMVMNCNPDHIKLSPDLVNDKHHLIHISNNCTLVDMYTISQLKDKGFVSESVEYIYETDDFEFDGVLESIENQLMEFAKENEIDYYDNDVLIESIISIDDEYDIVTEGTIANVWKALVEFIKKMIRAIVAMFKAVINFFKKIFNAIKNLIKGLLGFDMTPNTFSYIAMESASVNTIRPRDNKEIESKLRKSCDKMSRELQKLSKNQTKIMDDIKKNAEKQAKEHVNESTLYIPPKELVLFENVNQQKVDRAKTFSYYHLEEKKKDYSWDEEQYYKTIDDSIKAELYNLANSESGEKEGKQSFYVYIMGKEYKSICLGKIMVRWFDFYDKNNPKYDYEWEETFDIDKSLIDEDINPVTESSPLNPVAYIKRNHKLNHPMLNYDDLIDYYRKQLFHKRLKPLEWQALYNELIGVKEYLQRVSNETDRPDNRMAYESRKALKEIEGFIQYMEQKNEDMVIESSFNKSNKVPIYIVSWNYGSFVGNMVRLTTGSIYNHTSIALTSDLEDCYTFSRNPETTKSHSTNGFCRESLSYMVNRYGDCTIKVDAVYISKNNYKKLQNIINEYKKHESDTSFDYVNFARILFNIEKEDLDENKLNCSVFTDLVLKKSGIDVTNGKSSNLVTPSDLSNLDKTNKNVVTVYSGLASDYNKNNVITESSLKSNIDKDFKAKGSKKLSQFKQKELTKFLIDKYKDSSKLLKHVDCINDRCIGFFDGNKLVGYVCVNKESDGIIWITALEITNDYKGYGLGNQLLDYAVKSLHARALGVAKNNNIAYQMYEKYGFKTSKKSIDEVNQGKRNNYRMYYGDVSESNYNIINDEFIITESTYIEGTKDNTKYYPVFIFLSYTDTNMAKLIKSFTHDPYAHSSISFDTELNHMVSFNREGMVEENINEKIWKKNKDRIKYSLYMYMASAEEYESMRNFVNELLGRRSKLRYNVLGLTNFVFGRGSEREDKYFCSEFVASVISAGNSNIIKTRPYMTSPYMLAKNKNFKFIKKGILKNYNSKVVDNLVKDILEERGFEDVTIK